MKHSDNDLIIDSPQLQKPLTKFSYAFLTFLFWLLWVYLWVPLFSALAWLFGARLFYEHMIVLGGYEGFLQLMGWYALAIVVISAVLIVWALYNQLRFRGRERRRFVEPVTVYELSSFFHVDPNGLARWRESKRIRISIDDNGKIGEILADGG